MSRIAIPTNMIPRLSPWIVMLATMAYVIKAGTMPKVDKTPWKPIVSNSTSNSTKTTRRQYSPTVYYSHNPGGIQNQVPVRPPAIPSPVSFPHPPQMIYGNPTPTRTLPSTVSTPVQFRQVNSPPSNYAAYGDQMKISSSNAHPNYAAPVQPHQYQLVSPLMPIEPTVPLPSPPLQPVSYQVVAQPSQVNSAPAPSETQYQLVVQPSSPPNSRSYAPSSSGIQLQMIHPSPMDMSINPTSSNPYTIISSTPSLAPFQNPVQVSSYPVAPPHQTNDNATFVDVVSVLSKYFRTTGIQLSEMYQQLSDNAELNGWGHYPWSTPTTTTTTTTPAPPTTAVPTPPPQPPYQSPVVVMPIVMPSAASTAPAPPPSLPPAPPVVHTYSPAPQPPPPPPPSFSQPQASFSHVQPSYSVPPPSFYMPQPAYSQPPPMFLQPPSMYPQPPPPQPVYYSNQHPPIMYSQGQPEYSQHPPDYQPNQPPPTFSQHSHSHEITHSAISAPPPPLENSHPSPGFPEGKSANFEILDNSLDHDYYYDCDK